MPQPGLQTPSAPLVGGNTVREPILQDYVFQSGIHDPEVSSVLTYKFPQYYLTSLLDRLDAEEETSQDIFSWFVQDRTRSGSTVSSIATSLPAASVTLTTGFTVDASNGNLGYLIKGDSIRFESGLFARVDAVDNSGATQVITISKVGGGTITATELATTDAFGHVASLFEEYSDAPNGRLYLPNEEFNTLSIIRRSFSVSGSEYTNKTYIGDGKSWYFEKEDIEMKELAKDKECATMFGKLSTGAVRSSRGLLDYALTYGVTNGYSTLAGVTEEDIQEQIRDLLVQNVSNEITVLCGADFLRDAQRALRDYSIGGGQALDKYAGLDFQSYKFMGKTIMLAYYELFDDPEVLPTPVNGVDASERIDFSNFSLWLDMGTESNGRPLIMMKYKSNNGVSRKFIHTYESGMMEPSGISGGMVSNGKDGFTIHYLIECGLEVRLPNRLGVLRATS